MLRGGAWLMLLAAAACAGLLAQGWAAGADDALLKQAREIFQPLPTDMGTTAFPVTPARVALGRALFFDVRLSVDGMVSCVTCHQPAHYGADGLARSRGARGRLTARNTPSVLNAALQLKQGWRGDWDDVESQATAALVSPDMYGQPSLAAAMAKLKSIAGYRALFAKAFPGEADPETPANWGKAIGAYERTLVTPAPFDRFLAGDATALSPEARKGLGIFIDSGCVDCHAGPGVGGGMIQKFGLAGDYWKATHSKTIDKGRFDITHKRDDLYFFKVASLRNVAKTAPYFHDGSVADLADAVRIMAKLQVQRTFTDAEVRDVIAFLDSLTGALPADFAPPPAPVQ
ncbi:MAG TPA: cytochrome c peroxidase [Alphaproteobacteria bacterium]|nr:cytochrome c peroxidase [Alphaproteobacteria bacterium]